MNQVAMPLKMKKITLFEIDDIELNRFIKKEYGKDFSFAADQEAPRDSQHRFSVNGDLDSFDQASIEKFKKTGNFSYLSRILLDDLCQRKILESGTYLINVD